VPRGADDDREMAVTVRSGKTVYKYSNASAINVNNGILQVLRDSRVMAVYAADQWTGAETADRELIEPAQGPRATVLS
jgi:hypothetical protein